MSESTLCFGTLVTEKIQEGRSLCSLCKLATARLSFLSTLKSAVPDLEAEALTVSGATGWSCRGGYKRKGYLLSPLFQEQLKAFDNEVNAFLDNMFGPRGK